MVEVGKWVKGMFTVGIAAVFGIGIYSYFSTEQKTKKNKNSEKSEKKSGTEKKESPKEINNNNNTMDSKIMMNVNMMNLRTVEDWKGIIELAKDTEDLLLKTFLAEAYSRVGDKDTTVQILDSIKKSEPKDSYDQVALGKAFQLSDDRETAFEWFAKASSNDNPIAIYTLAVYHQNGIFVKKDVKKAQEYFRMAAKFDEPISQYLLALTLLDSAEASELLEKSAQKKYLPAIFALGDICTQKRDHKKAIEYYKECTKMNYCPALRSYSFLLMNGVGVDHNEELAIQLLEKGIELGDVESTVTLSTYYQAGKGVEKDEKKAFDLCNNIEKKTAVVYYQLSLFYLNGVGVTENDEKHLEYLKASAQMGYPAALFLLANYLLGNPSKNEDVSVAIDYLAAAAKSGYTPAIEQLQQIYEQTFSQSEKQ